MTFPQKIHTDVPAPQTAGGLRGACVGEDGVVRTASRGAAGAKAEDAQSVWGLIAEAGKMVSALSVICHPINPRSEKSGGCGWGCTVCPLSVTRGGLVGKAQAIPWITHISAIHTFHPGILFLRENRKQGNKLPARRRSPGHYFIRVKTTNNVTI